MFLWLILNIWLQFWNYRLLYYFIFETSLVKWFLRTKRQTIVGNRLTPTWNVAQTLETLDCQTALFSIYQSNMLIGSMNIYEYEWIWYGCCADVKTWLRQRADRIRDGMQRTDRDDKCNEMFPISMHINQTFQTNIFAVDYE